MASCTMQDEIGGWLRTLVQLTGSHPYKTGKKNLGEFDWKFSLPLLSECLVDGAREMLANHHRADTDALLHWMVCREICARI